MTAKRTLFISAHFCSSDVPAAGHKLAAQKLAELAASSGHVDVITFRTARDRARRARIRPVENVSTYALDITEIGRGEGVLRYPNLPVAAATRRWFGHRLCKYLLDQSDYDRIYLDFTQAAAVLPSSVYGRSEIRVHDVLHELYGRQRDGKGGAKALLAGAEAWRARRWEKLVLSQIGVVNALTERDCASLTALTERSDIQVATPTGYYTVDNRKPETIESGMLLFWGNMSRAENSDAVRYFASEIFPIIKAEVPEAHFVVGGADPAEELIVELADVAQFTGFVDDPGDLFRRCHVGVVPLRFGAGVKIKTLELIGSGIPSVATPIGAEGVGLSSLLHEEAEPQAFAKRCIDLLRGAGF